MHDELIIKKNKPKILHVHGVEGHMTHNRGMDPYNVT